MISFSPAIQPPHLHHRIGAEPLTLRKTSTDLDPFSHQVDVGIVIQLTASLALCNDLASHLQLALLSFLKYLNGLKSFNKPISEKALLLNF